MSMQYEYKGKRKELPPVVSFLIEAMASGAFPERGPNSSVRWMRCSPTWWLVEYIRLSEDWSRQEEEPQDPTDGPGFSVIGVTMYLLGMERGQKFDASHEEILQITGNIRVMVEMELMSRYGVHTYECGGFDDKAAVKIIPSEGMRQFIILTKDLENRIDFAKNSEDMTAVAFRNGYICGRSDEKLTPELGINAFGVEGGETDKGNGTEGTSTVKPTEGA
jgi:hypothetical protein